MATVDLAEYPYRKRLSITLRRSADLLEEDHAVLFAFPALLRKAADELDSLERQARDLFDAIEYDCRDDDCERTFGSEHGRNLHERKSHGRILTTA